MAMLRRSEVKNPLDPVFSAPGHVAILRVLSRSAEPASGRQVARDAGINHQACAEGLRRLEALGLVHREVQGRAHAFTLNAGHPIVDDLIKPLYRQEDALPRSPSASGPPPEPPDEGDEAEPETAAA